MILSDKFICATKEYSDYLRPVPAPWFKKNLELKGGLTKASITVCGLGFYELYCNGKRVGEIEIYFIPRSRKCSLRIITEAAIFSQPF